MKNSREMRFATFANTVKAHGAVNRMPNGIGGADLLSYSVYMDGPVADALPDETLDHEYSDSRIHTLTENMGLDVGSLRDKTKVAEVVAVRNAWMSAVLDATTDLSGGELSPEILEDSEVLSGGLDHPWIMEQIDSHKALTAKLSPVLKAASEAVGRAVTDTFPEEITRGTVVAQSTDFTVQTGSAGVVAHENRRLATVPAVGDDVTILYYRGNGQVFAHNKVLEVTPPFIDARSGDLAVRLSDDKADQKLVLFNGVAAFAKFVEQQQLDQRMVEQAIKAREATPKKVVQGRLPEGAKEVTSGRWIGRIQSVQNGWAIQDAGRGALVAHDVNKFKRVPRVNDKIDIQYGRSGEVVLASEKSAGLEKCGR